MKVSGDDIVKAFRGLAIAAARAKGMAKEHGKEKLVGSLARRQQDSVRQHLLEIEADVQTLVKIMTSKK